MHGIHPDLAKVFADADESIVREIIRQAEAYLADQLCAGIAADQRATSFASIISAALALIVAGIATLIVSGDRSLLPLALPLAPLVICFFVALRLAIHAARPTLFDYCGNTPNGWRADILNGKPLKAALAEQAAHYAESINANSAILADNASSMRQAINWVWYGCLVAACGTGAALVLRFI